jgi:hypothetical protein
MAIRPVNRLNAAHQALALRAAFPSASVSVRRRRLYWVGKLRPTSISAEYTVRISCSPDKFPRVFVLDPELVTRPGESIPHLFKDGSLCLHKTTEWTSEMFIVDTIVPWASEWLAHYEVWLATGVWYGGGEWPPSDSAS